MRHIPLGLLATCAPNIERVFALEQRLARAAPYKPENHFPAALIDALSGYRYLVQTLGFEPCNIAVCGDSSGGHLAQSITRYLVVFDLEDLPPPGATILLSPTLDWGNTHVGTEHSTMKVNEPTDMVWIVLGNDYSPNAIRGNLPKDALKTDAWLSPGSLHLPETKGLFKNFPPTLVLASGAEQTVDAMRTWYPRLLADNGGDREKMKWVEYPDAMHDWIVHPFHEPERTLALEEIRAFLDRWLGRSS